MNSLLLISPYKGEALNQFFLVKIIHELPSNLSPDDAAGNDITPQALKLALTSSKYIPVQRETISKVPTHNLY